ncbi:MAG: SlyX family protein [Pseudomonadota bacterium]
MSVESELTELQIKVAFQEEAMDALDDVIMGQKRRMDRLQQQLQELQEKYETLIEQGSQAIPTADDDRPPHY